MANDQVAFSRKSAVCLTPINCEPEPVKFAARPPPFGFWTNTIKPNKTQTTKINIETNKIHFSIF